MNSDLEKEKNWEEMPGTEIARIVKQMKEKLEQMLRDQEIPAGSTGVEIDDLTAVHSELNAKLSRLDELDEYDGSVGTAEEAVQEAENKVEYHTVELDFAQESVSYGQEELDKTKSKHNVAKEVAKDEQELVKELEDEPNETEDAVANEDDLEDQEHEAEGFLEEEGVGEFDNPYRSIHQAQEDSDLSDEHDEGLYDRPVTLESEKAGEDAAAALPEDATDEERSQAYSAAVFEYKLHYMASATIQPDQEMKKEYAITNAKEAATRALTEKQEAEDDIDRVGVQLDEAEAEAKLRQIQLRDAESQLEMQRAFADNMKQERDKLKDDIINRLKPLAEKVNTIYGNFISAKKSNQVVEKSNKVKNELEELKKELNHTQDKTDEHKELVQHGKIKKIIINTAEIDQHLYDLTIKHDKILETLGEKNDRITSGLNLEEYVTVSHDILPEEHKDVRSFFIQRFNISETKLVTDVEKQRLDLEVDLAIFRQKKKLLNELLKDQERNVAKQVMGDALQFITGTDVEPPTNKHYTVQPDPILDQESSWISTLEVEFIKLVADIFKDINNWWTELVPDNVRYNARKRNDRNKDFLEWDKTEDFKLLHKLNFNALTQIFTGVKCWKYFSNVFPKPTDYQQDWLTSIKSKLIDLGYCRTRVEHSHRLDDMSHEILKGNYSFFVKCIEDFRNR